MSDEKNDEEKKKEEERCSICQRPFTGFGNNAYPVNTSRCCDHCNGTVVIPARMALLIKGKQ